MSSNTMNLVLLPRGRPLPKLPEEATVERSATTSEIYHRIAAETGTSIHRIRVTKGSDGQFIPNSKQTPISSTGLLDGSRIYVKDLGPQIGWRTVYFIEYLGPLLIHPLIYFARPYIYRIPANESSFPPPSPMQTLSAVAVFLHFFKREIETIFVHRFSASTMPARNVVKNSAYYWILTGLFMAYFIYGPESAAAEEENPFLSFAGLVMFFAGELCNLATHLTLRNLRSSGGKERGIPDGLGFNLVTCPNYMFEIIAWVGITLVTRSWATAVFNVVAIIQMGVWAKKRERNYRKEFGDKYKSKKYASLPLIY